MSSYTLLFVRVTVYYHHIVVLCFSYHVIYHIHLIFVYLSFSFIFYVCKYLRSRYENELYVPEGTITVRDSDLYLYVPEGIITVQDSDLYLYNQNGAVIMIKMGSMSSTQTGLRYL